MSNNKVQTAVDASTADLHDRAQGRRVAIAGFERAAPLRRPAAARPLPEQRGPGRGQPNANEMATDKVLHAFNTWAFKREQPDNPELLRRTVGAAVGQREAIPFVLYWGKGPRCRIGAPDCECLDYLASLADRVRDAHAPGAAITLIFTDTHARHNGHATESIEQYFRSVDGDARQRGFRSCRLSDLTRAAAATIAGEPIDDQMPDDVLQSLEGSAMKWYRGEGSVEEGARAYYHMNMIEKRAVEVAFPGSIFVTFNGSKLRALFPSRLPIFYMYSLRRGVGVKPWFLPAEAPLCEPQACHCGTDPSSRP